MNNAKAFILNCKIFLKAYLAEVLLGSAVLIIGICLFFGLGCPAVIASTLQGKTITFDTICKLAMLVENALFILTIVLAYAALRKNQSLFEAQMIFQYDKDYATKEMCMALRTLHDFMCKNDNLQFFSKHREPSRYPQKKIDFTSDDNFKWPDEVDDARRVVKMYFLNPYNMYVQGKISKSVFRCIIDKYGFPLLFDVVEKLEYLNNPDYENEKFYHIMLIADDIYTRQRKATARYNTNTYIKRHPQKEPIACNILHKLLKYCEKHRL